MKNTLRSKSRYLIPVIFFGMIFLFIGNKDGVAGHPPVKQFKSPQRITFGPADNLIVSDSGARSIFIVDRNKNRILRSFKIKGKPLAVAYLKGKYFVGNRTTGKVEVYNGSGKMRSSFGYGLKQPNDMEIDSNGEKIYLVDTQTGRMLIYTIEGQLLKTVSDNLTAPTGITLDELNGLVYVSDYGDPAKWSYPAIHIFSLEGVYTGKISGKLGMMGNRFSRPQGLAVNDDGYVFMIDCYSSEIMVFNGPGGILIKTISGYGDAPGRMRLPIDLVINKKTKDIFVTNNRLLRIEVFRKGGK